MSDEILTDKKKKPQRPSAQPGWTVMAVLMGSERVTKDESGEGTEAYLSDTQLDMQQNILILRVKLDIASYLMIRYTW